MGNTRGDIMKDIIKQVKNDKGIVFNAKIYKDKIEKDYKPYQKLVKFLEKKELVNDKK